ncbi:MAG: undecaprenyl/decaprenyl-phosphate alpha-N-acetylglucosaminyl 1-phosphate transferase [Alicyclobacillus sp.]|nr:undecaprenyl/decaprenyl-phosphate alpha-N-acetylglucosaminyl 1-phosphate transferase [Alicyclobacillus sp.]
MRIWAAGCIALAISLLLVPLVRRCAIRWRFYDMPNARKVHRTPLPLLGGTAIVAGFLAASLLVSPPSGPGAPVYWSIFGGTLMLYAIGTVDDFFKTRRRDFSAGVRLLVQVGAATWVALAGGKVHTLSVPFGGGHYVVLPAAISWPLTVIWIVGVINVFNFLDGLDGLAAGIGVISGVTLTLFAYKAGDTQSAVLAAGLAGGALGFLRYNFYPARIIMGDAGSTCIGFVLAAVSALGAYKSATLVSIVVPVLALGLPIFDAIRVVIGRARRRQPVYRPDQTHSHHRLLNAGFSQVQTVTVLYLVSACFALASVILMLVQRG